MLVPAPVLPSPAAVPLRLGLVDKPDQGTHPFLSRGIFNLDNVHDSGDGVLHAQGG